MDEIRLIEVAPMDMLSLSILVLFVGMYLNRKIRLLGDNYIPPRRHRWFVIRGGGCPDLQLCACTA